MASTAFKWNRLYSNSKVDNDDDDEWQGKCGKMIPEKASRRNRGRQPRHADAVHSCRRLVPHSVFYYAQQWFDGVRCEASVFVSFLFFGWMHALLVVCHFISELEIEEEPTLRFRSNIFEFRAKEKLCRTLMHLLLIEIDAGGIWMRNGGVEGTSSKYFQWINKQMKNGIHREVWASPSRR